MKKECTIHAQRKIAEDTCEVVLCPVEGDFPFQAGQYVQVNLPEMRHADPKGASRVFSLVSSPCNVREFAVAFRATGSGFKKTLMELPRGSTVLVEGPSGFFTLPEDDAPVVWIAGGIGITPCLSMLRYLQDCAPAKEKKRNTLLVYANRDHAHAAYWDELKEREAADAHFSLKARFGGMDYETLAAAQREAGAAAWWYVVGPPGMVALAQQALQQLGVDARRVLTEEFSGYA